MAARSVGHIAFAGRFEYFRLESGDVVRAPVTNPMRCDVPARNGARFVGTRAWAEYWLESELRDMGPAIGLERLELGCELALEDLEARA